MEQQARAWRGRRVLVTGADGFLGSHLVERLLERGATVAVLVRPSSVVGTAGHALRNLAPVQASLDEIIAADVAGSDAVEAMVAWAPERLLHLAADAYVERSFTHPAEVLRTNLDGTLRVLEAARRIPGLERVLVTSSSEIYGDALTPAIDEQHPLAPTSPYAASKVAADRLAYAYHRTHGLPVAIIRPFNTFGPRHPYDVIPKLIARALAGEPLVVYGSGEQSRDFSYVDDMVEAFLVMGSHPEAIGRALNFGTGVATSIRELAGRIVAISGSSSPIVHGPPRAAEVRRLCCDHGLATRLLGWRPRVTLDDGLARNLAWAREHAAP
ncbi:MAG: SDR family NAD(P)-dependent oxidoreductase [Myxococcales bacterium]|nr:SDR family NAD(P)-dependent oxidoreductase [Myxococcales bacterium]